MPVTAGGEVKSLGQLGEGPLPGEVGLERAHRLPDRGVQRARRGRRQRVGLGHPAELAEQQRQAAEDVAPVPGQ